MDLDIYNGIIEASGEDPFAMDLSKKPHVPFGERILRHDILVGKTVWTNQMCSDYLTFLRCRHPLLAPCFVPKYHPYGRSQRFQTLFAMLALGSLSATLSAWASERYGEDVISEYEVKILISVINGIALTLMEACLRCLFECGVAEVHYHDEGCCCCCECCYFCCKCFANWGIRFWFVFALVCLAATLLLTIFNNLFVLFAIIFGLQFAISWILQFFGLLIKFYANWKQEHTMIEDIDISSRYDYNKIEENDDEHDDNLELLAKKNKNKNKTKQSNKSKALLDDYDDKLKKQYQSKSKTHLKDNVNPKQFRNVLKKKYKYYITYKDYESYMARPQNNK